MLAGELEGGVEVGRLALRHGPLTTLARVSEGKLGGPLLRVVYRRFFYDRATYLLTVVLLPAVSALGVLVLTNESLGAKVTLRLLLAAVVVLVGLVAVLVTYAIALRKTRRTVLSMGRDWGAAETKTVDCGVSFKPQAAGSIPAGRTLLCLGTSEGTARKRRVEGYWRAKR